MRKRHKRISLIFKSLSLILVIVVVFFVLKHKNTVTTLEYQISLLEKKKMQLIKEKDQLRAEKLKLASIDNIKKFASAHEEFQFPDRKKVITVVTTKEAEPRSAAYKSK
ncbi:MAG: hypothetical protein N3A59_01455 [Thermodesulfovibrionales bacterium]|nr:hypothetical protein [Thermodesulfovibrionales bacterium]